MTYSDPSLGVSALHGCTFGLGGGARCHPLPHCLDGKGLSRGFEISIERPEPVLATSGSAKGQPLCIPLVPHQRSQAIKLAGARTFLVCAALWAPTVLHTAPVDGEYAVRLVQAALIEAGLAPVPIAPPLRPLPACAHAPTVAPFQGRWTAAALSCTAPHPWRRVLRVATDAQPASMGSSNPAPREGAATMMVTARSLRRGHRLALGDLVPARLSGVDPAQVVGQATDVVGRRLRAAVGAGQPLLERQLDPALAVERGQSVVIEAAGGGLAVATAGEALVDGGIGDVIRVHVLSGGREIEAEITGTRRVRVSPKLSDATAVSLSKRRSP